MSTMMTFLRRLLGAAVLDSATYEEVERDRGATIQSCLVVVLACLSAGIGATGLYDTAATLRFFAVSTAIALMTWAAWALLTLQIGTRILPAAETRADLGQMLRTLGFSAAPGLIQAFAVLPGMVLPVFAIAIIWTIAASVIAVRQALDYRTLSRALAVCALGWILALLFAVVLGVAFGPVVAAR
jgi:hypothetical protein